MGMESPDPIRFEYTLPEEVGIESADMQLIDSIVNEGIAKHAYPGAQVFIAKEGKVIYHKAFGQPTYEDSVFVSKSDLYDLASVTKIASTLLAVMYLDGEGELYITECQVLICTAENFLKLFQLG